MSPEKSSDQTTAESQLINPAEVIIYINAHKSTNLQKPLGLYLRAVRSRIKLNAPQFAMAVGMKPHGYQDLERGERVPNANNIDRLVTTIGALTSEDDPIAQDAVAHLTAIALPLEERERIEDLLLPFPGKIIYRKTHKRRVEEETTDTYEADQALEQTKWLRTIRLLPLQKVIKYLYLAQGYELTEFAKDARIGKRTLQEIILDGKPPLLNTVNKIIDASPLDSQSKAAQTLRLKAEDLRANDKKHEPMSLEKFQKATWGDIYEYFRIITGHSHKELAALLKISPRSSFYIAHNRRKMTDRIFEKFLDLLELPPDGAIVEILRDKRAGNLMLLSTQQRTSMIEGPYLFSNSEKPKQTGLFSPEQEALIEKLTQHNSFGEKLNFLIGQKELEQRKPIDRLYLQKAGRGSRTGQYEVGNQHPEDFTAVAILAALGYDIHNPITWHMLDQLEIDREAKEQRRKSA